MRTEEDVSARNWLAKLGRLTSTEKIKSATAIERIVRMVLRLLLRRFLRTSLRYFIIRVSSVLRLRLKCRVGLGSGSAGCRTDEDALVETVNGIDEAFGPGIVCDHHDRL